MLERGDERHLVSLPFPAGTERHDERIALGGGGRACSRHHLLLYANSGQRGLSRFHPPGDARDAGRERPTNDDQPAPTGTRLEGFPIDCEVAGFVSLSLRTPLAMKWSPKSSMNPLPCTASRQ